MFPRAINDLEQIGLFKRRWLSVIAIGQCSSLPFEYLVPTLSEVTTLDFLWRQDQHPMEPMPPCRTVVSAYAVQDIDHKRWAKRLLLPTVTVPTNGQAFYGMLLVDEGPLEGAPYLDRLRRAGPQRLVCLLDVDGKRRSPTSALMLARPILMWAAKTSEGVETVTVEACAALEYSGRD